MKNGLLLTVEVVLIAATLFAHLRGLVPLSSTPFFFLIASASLYVRKVGWRGVGLVRPSSWKRAILVGVGAGPVFQCLSLYVLEPVLGRVLGKLPDVHIFAPLVGNSRFFLVSFVVAWTLAAFGEESFFRGYLMSRVADFGLPPRLGSMVALLVSSTLFGAVHAYQGLSGVLATGLSGLAFGLLYLVSNRNLWTPILAHGAYDTLGFLLIFLGAYPGL